MRSSGWFSITFRADCSKVKYLASSTRVLDLPRSKRSITEIDSLPPRRSSSMPRSVDRSSRNSRISAKILGSLSNGTPCLPLLSTMRTFSLLAIAVPSSGYTLRGCRAFSLRSAEARVVDRSRHIRSRDLLSRRFLFRPSCFRMSPGIPAFCRRSLQEGCPSVPRAKLHGHYNENRTRSGTLAVRGFWPALRFQEFVPFVAVREVGLNGG